MLKPQFILPLAEALVRANYSERVALREAA
jgi:hypothetical protein